MLTGLIAVGTFAWNIMTGISEQKAKIERLEYQISLGEAKDREIQEKYELLSNGVERTACRVRSLKICHKRETINETHYPGTRRPYWSVWVAPDHISFCVGYVFLALRLILKQSSFRLRIGF